MGMFDKDKEIGLILQNEFKQGEEFVLHGVSVDDETVPTEIGPARKTRMNVERIENGRPNGTIYEITTLASAIADKAEEAVPDDFPAVVKWLQVRSRFNNDATVLQFVRAL